MTVSRPSDDTSPAKPTPAAQTSPAPNPTVTADVRVAGRPQAVTLLLASCLVVLGAVLLTPIQPKMQDAFADTAGVDILVPIVITIPALMIGLLAPIAGLIVDRLGRKRVLISALVVYALVGTAPLWLDSLVAIVVSRVGVGIAEAALLTTCTTLIADYFEGEQRNRYLGLQTVFTTIAAIIFFGLGGALGDVSWRAPFWLYTSALAFAVAVAFLIWQPQRLPHEATGVTPDGSTAARFPWRLIAKPCLVTLLGGVVFYTPIVELSFKLDQIGVESVGKIGALSALGSIATAVGAFTFSKLVRRGHLPLLVLAFGTAGVGVIIMGLGPAVPVVAIGAVVASAGTGLMLPTLLTWAINPLPYEQRGSGTGLWTASLSIGQFFCPLIVIGFKAGLGGLPVALAVIGCLSVALAAGVFVVATRQRSAQLA